MTDVLAVPDGHPALAAQRRINTVLTGRVSTFPIYKNGKYVSREVLADVQALARWVITAVDHEGLSHYLPGDLASALKAHRRLLDWPYGMYWNSVAAVPNVIDAAVGITAATSILGQPTSSTASTALRRLMRYAAKRRAYAVPISDRSISRVLTTIQAVAAAATDEVPPDDGETAINGKLVD
jgi:hypothetical protein